MLIILGGLPGTGKTTLAQSLARDLKAVHLRVDAIEGELFLNAGRDAVGDLGYRISHHLAADNLALGQTVIADQVNSSDHARKDWRAVAERSGYPFVEILLICSDEAEWRRRIEARSDGMRWDTVATRVFEPWESAATIDTAGLSPDALVNRACEILDQS